MTEPIKVGTAIIGRTRSVVCTAGFDLIKAGCPVQIMGKDIAGDLKETIGEVLGRRNFRTTLDEFDELMKAWISDIRESCINKETKEPFDEKAEFLAECEENCATITAISMRAMAPEGETRDVQLLVKQIDTYFIDGDNVDTKAIICCTGHGAKGLEYDRVVILRPDLFPHPKAEMDEDIVQEENLKYVALTRAMKEMWVCHDSKPD